MLRSAVICLTLSYPDWRNHNEIRTIFACSDRIAADGCCAEWAIYRAKRQQQRSDVLRLLSWPNFRRQSWRSRHHALAGLPAATILTALNNFASNPASNPMMHQVASALAPDERQAVATYLVRTEGQLIFPSACMRCMRAGSLKKRCCGLLLLEKTTAPFFRYRPYFRRRRRRKVIRTSGRDRRLHDIRGERHGAHARRRPRRKSHSRRPAAPPRWWPRRRPKAGCPDDRSASITISGISGKVMIE